MYHALQCRDLSRTLTGEIYIPYYYIHSNHNPHIKTNIKTNIIKPYTT